MKKLDTEKTKKGDMKNITHRVNRNKDEVGNVWWNNKETRKKKTFMIQAFDLETGFGEKKQFELQTIWLKFEFTIYFPLYTRRRRDEKEFHNKVGGNYK